MSKAGLRFWFRSSGGHGPLFDLGPSDNRESKMVLQGIWVACAENPWSTFWLLPRIFRRPLASAGLKTPWAFLKTFRRRPQELANFKLASLAHLRTSNSQPWFPLATFLVPLCLLLLDNVDCSPIRSLEACFLRPGLTLRGAWVWNRAPCSGHSGVTGFFSVLDPSKDVLRGKWLGELVQIPLQSIVWGVLFFGTPSFGWFNLG